MLVIQPGPANTILLFRCNKGSAGFRAVTIEWHPRSRSYLDIGLFQD